MCRALKRFPNQEPIHTCNVSFLAMRILGEKWSTARWLQFSPVWSGKTLLPPNNDPGAELTPPFPTDIEHKGEMLPGIGWILSPYKGIWWAEVQLLPLTAPGTSSESGKRNRHKTQPQQKYREGFVALSPLPGCLAEGRCMHIFCNKCLQLFHQ